MFEYLKENDWQYSVGYSHTLGFTARAWKTTPRKSHWLRAEKREIYIESGKDEIEALQNLINRLKNAFSI